MTLSCIFLLAAALTSDTAAILTNDTFHAQCWLDSYGFSVNCIDGVWGLKSKRAKELFEKSGGEIPARPFPMKRVTVSQMDVNELVEMPQTPEEKADLEYMGYATLKEMFAERGHVSQKCLEKLNPEITDWRKVGVGDRILIPDMEGVDVALSTNKATLLTVSLKRCEIIAYDQDGNTIGFFPCSVAANKTNLPPHGELSVGSHIENPNYTYTPDTPPPDGSKPKKYILEPGPNNPVGLAWIGLKGLDLQGYGIHGTPTPESVGNAESHGCFRVANWNALKLYRLTDFDTKVSIEP